jgi:hypothetical protein
VLRDLQRQFMNGVLDRAVVAGLKPAEALSIYANNARVNFTQTLKLTYPALWRLVGEDYFRQCARAFQGLRPSSSGDLQHVGEGFSRFLADLHADDEFSYLADVARFEWAYQEALVEAELPALDLSRLATVRPERYLELRFRLQPSARLVDSRFPVFRIWEANVADPASEELINLEAGFDRLLVLRAFKAVRVHRLTTGEFAFLAQLTLGAQFGAAVDAATLADVDFDPSAALQKLSALHAIVDFHL